MSAPLDPRLGRALPAFGELPAVESVGPLATRVLAPNPSLMTLDGTNTYVIGEPGSGVVAIVDPGPDLPDHRARVEEQVRAADAAVSAILVTHHHLDHAEAASAWAAHVGATVAAPTGDVAGPDGRILVDGDRVAIGGMTVEVVATPGHTHDHIAFRLPDGSLLVGDHVLGRGTSVVAYPDGDLEAYLASLRRVLALGPDALLPGHGPVLAEDPESVLRYYLAHRAYREEQILASLADGPLTPGGIVEVVYAEVDRSLWDAAEASTRAAVAKLEGEGRLTWDGDEVRRAGGLA